MPGQPHVVTKAERSAAWEGRGTHKAAGGNGVDLPCEDGVAEGTGAWESE